MDTRERVIAIIAEQALLEPSDIREDMSLADLGLDSLGLVESIFAIEEAFDLRVPFNANEPQASEFDVSTVGAMIKAVERLVMERA
ncbi:acyl carrier protein [Rubellimicrobium rubrum]|uniref:Acyl carrier protein n=1 Tax=Rubellimicrobium rubrum TaxID=2585369 RepID=A0A5C4N1E8_9RHOB|nr:phosphopantetheine-binding protein [Rubellimicrobium rubrum]TNC51110.1 acyl carrier protein [Rubellimicrobium rubrum]